MRRWVMRGVAVMLFVGCSAPSTYAVSLDARVVGDAPLTVSGSAATIDVASGRTMVRLVVTATEPVVLDDPRWTYVHRDRRGEATLAVFGHGCHLSIVGGEHATGCTDEFRILPAAPGAPLEEQLTVELLTRGGAGEAISWTETVRWWRPPPGVDHVDVVERPADGKVEVALTLSIRRAT